jgi:hypothetical protein
VATISFISTSKLAQLLNEANVGRDTYVRVLSTNRLAIGTDPLQPTHIIDFSNESVSWFDSTRLTESGEQPTSHSLAGPRMPRPSANGSKTTRRTGDYWLEIKGHRIYCGSLKELLAEGLRALEAIRPGTLDRLSQIKLRSRRIVAQNPQQLFDKQHLATRYAEQLTEGWWYGTNNSAAETNAWLERASSCSGLKWPDELKTNMTNTLDDLLKKIEEPN